MLLLYRLKPYYAKSGKKSKLKSICVDDSYLFQLYSIEHPPSNKMKWNIDRFVLTHDKMDATFSPEHRSLTRISTSVLPVHSPVSN